MGCVGCASPHYVATGQPPGPRSREVEFPLVVLGRWMRSVLRGAAGGFSLLSQVGLESELEQRLELPLPSHRDFLSSAVAPV